MADPQNPAPPTDPRPGSSVGPRRRPMKATPPPPEVPLWRRIAEFAGVDDEIDAVSSAAQTAGDWINSKLPQPSPESKARYDQFAREWKAREAEMERRRQANWETISGPVKRFFGSEPVQQVGQQLKEDYKHLWTPPPETLALADMAHKHLKERSDALRAVLPKMPVTLHGGETGPLRGLSATVDPLAPLDWAVAAQNDWIPNYLLDTAVDASTPVGAASNLADVGPAVKAAAPLLAKLAPGLADVAMAGIPNFPIKLPRSAGALADAVKRGEPALHPLRASAAERVARLTDFADTFPRQSNWRGINDPRYVRAFGDDVTEAGRHLRAFAAASPSTGVPDNAREAAALQAWRLLNPGKDITHAETRNLRGQVLGNATSKWQNVNDAWNDRVMGRSKYNDALKVESFGNFMHDRHGLIGHPMQRRSRPSDIIWTPDRSVPLVSLPHDMHMLYGTGGLPQELLDDEWGPLRQRLSSWEGLIHPETKLPLAGNQGGFTNKDLYDRVTWSLANTLENQRPGMPLQQSFGRFWTGAQANKLLEQGKKVPFAGGFLDIYDNVGLLEPGALTDPDAIYRALERRKDWYNLGWGPGK